MSLFVFDISQTKKRRDGELKKKEEEEKKEKKDFFFVLIIICHYSEAPPPAPTPEVPDDEKMVQDELEAATRAIREVCNHFLDFLLPSIPTTY
jgi:hypothetical protein